MNTKLLMPSVVLAVVAVGSADGAPIFSYSYTDGQMGNAQTWGGSDNTTNSVIIETLFDYTQAAIDQLAMPATDSLIIWEAGGGTLGSNVLLGSTNVYLRVKGDGNLDAIGAHGLSGVTLGVQIVSVIDLENDEISV